MTEDTALRLELFGASAEFWLNLQVGCQLALARRQHDAAIDAIELRGRVT